MFVRSKRDRCLRGHKKVHVPYLRHLICKVCAQRRSEEFAKASGYKYQKLNSWRKVGIKITLEEYERLLQKQNGKCRICLRKPDRALDVDHCHKTKRIRGLLCNPCNKALGVFKDSKKRLLRAIEYLGESK